MTTNDQAIPEIPDLKSGLFKRLANVLPDTAILGSNTSSISLTRLAKAAETGSPGASERVVGYALHCRDDDPCLSHRIHFFNPVPIM